MMTPAKKALFYLILYAIIAMPMVGVYADSAASHRQGELDEFNDILLYHSFPASESTTQLQFDPQWFISQYTVDDDFILQGVRVLIEEDGVEIDNLTMHVYEHDGSDLPGDFIFTYNDDVDREAYDETRTWLELELPVNYHHVFQSGDSFWISIGSLDPDSWSILQDQDGNDGDCLISSTQDGSQISHMANGDWIMEAGGSYSWDDFDLEATLLWNAVGKYHLPIDSQVNYRGTISNIGDAPSPSGIYQLEVRDEAGENVFTAQHNLPAMPMGGVFEVLVPESWTADLAGRYVASLEVEVNGDINNDNNSTALYQQIVGLDDLLMFDDSTAENTYFLPADQDLAVMFTPPEHPAKSAQLSIYFDLGQPIVELAAYQYEDFQFTRFWEFVGPVDEGWITFAMPSPSLYTGAVAVVIEDAGGDGVEMDDSYPSIGPNPLMPFSYFLKENNVWNPDPVLNGKPLVQMRYENPVALQTIELNLEPTVPQVYIEPGESFTFNSSIDNTLQVIQEVDIWTEMIWPTGELFSPLMVLDNISLIPNVTLELPEHDQSIPLSAPTGIYQFRMNVGQRPDAIANFNSFNVIVSDGTSVNGDSFAAANIHEGITVSQAYPNPFNPTTSFTIELAQPGHLSVDLIDIMGRHVLHLADGEYGSGQVLITVDGSELPSGTYFARVQMNGFTSITRRLILLK